MPMEGTYEPSPSQWVADQVRDYEASNGKVGGTLRGYPVVILTTRGRTTGKLRKSALMRVERDGRYVVIASMGGAPAHPTWYLNLVADPVVTLQDGASLMDVRARTATPEEKADWWPVAVEAFPPYAEYQAKTERDIPVVILDPA